MPVPTPNGGENEQDFTERCMSNDKMVSDFPDEKQRYAVCMSSWRDKKTNETIDEAIKNIAKKLGVIILFFCTTATAQTNRITYKAGLLTPIPVNVMADYQLDVSSAMIQANYQIKGKWSANLSTGYFRFRSNEYNLKRFSNIPILAGGKYTFGNFHAGLMAGPSLFNEGEKENFWRWMWVPTFGWTKNHWGVELLYFNWEEIPNEYNNLGLLVSYSF